jgi:hypothetical protein
MTDRLEVWADPPPLAPAVEELELVELPAEELDAGEPDLSQPFHFPGQITWARPTFVQPWTWVTPQ